MRQIVTFAVLLLLAPGCNELNAREVVDRCGKLLDSCSETCKAPAESPMDPTGCWKRCADAYATCRQDR